MMEKSKKKKCETSLDIRHVSLTCLSRIDLYLVCKIIIIS